MSCSRRAAPFSRSPFEKFEPARAWPMSRKNAQRRNRRANLRITVLKNEIGLRNRYGSIFYRECYAIGAKFARGGLPALEGAPADIAAAEAPWPMNLVNRRVGPLPRLGHIGANAGHVQHPAAIGDQPLALPFRTGMGERNERHRRGIFNA